MASTAALVSQLKHAAKHTKSNLKNYVDLPQRKRHTRERGGIGKKIPKKCVNGNFAAHAMHENGKPGNGKEIGSF